jgi:Ca2+-binding EF-hand superfamily protein
LVEEFEGKLAKVVWNETGLEPMPAKKGKANQAKAKPAEAKKKWDWFAALDSDKDGFVTEEEWVKRGRASATRKGEAYDEKRHRAYFANRDANGDGRLTREELEK